MGSIWLWLSLLALLSLALSRFQPYPDTDHLFGTCDAPHCFRNGGGPRPKRHHFNFTVTSQVIPGTTDKPSIVVNGMLPGPTIEVNEGDMVVVDVYNQLQTAVAIHWHGLYQVGRSYMDGIPNVSHCLYFGGSRPLRYRWKAEPAGTTWWHAHFDNQYIDGLFGPLIIHRKGGDLYRHIYSSEKVWIVNDWYDYPAAILRTQWYLTPQNVNGYEPAPDAIMVNGKFTPNLSYQQDPTENTLIRIINSAGFSMYNFSVDKLLLNIVAIDGVDISPPLVVPWVVVNVAQRVDIILEFAAYPITGATSINFHVDAVLSMYPYPNGILDYTQPSPPYKPNTQCRFNPYFIGTFHFTKPTSVHYGGGPVPVPSPLVCDPNTDMNFLDARPFDYVPTPAADYSLNVTISFQNIIGTQLAYLNDITFPVNTIGSQYGMPELYAFVKQSLDGTAEEIALAASGPGPALQNDGSLRFYIPDNAVVDIFVINTDNGEHPFHMHGHQFPIIATSACPQAQQAFSGNYLRRDVVSIPPVDPNGNNGWAWIRLVASNPGVWMFHCHIDWHMEAGLACLFMEGPTHVLNNIPPSDQVQFCQSPTSFCGSSTSSSISGFGTDAHTHSNNSSSKNNNNPVSRQKYPGSFLEPLKQ